MNNGWIKIHRGLLNWQWHDDPEMLSLWITLLMMASYEDRDCDGVPIGRGQIKTTVKDLSLQTGVTQKKLRGRLERLSKGHCIGKETAKGYTIITICNYDSYQSEEETEGTQRALKGQQEGHSKGTQRALKGHSLYNKEDKKKEEKNIKESTLSCTKEKFLTDWGSEWRLPTSLPAEERMSALADQIKPHVDNYGRDLCNAFYRYWVEDQGKGIMRFENVKKYATFQTASRLATWYRLSSGRERSLPLQVEASLPSIDNVASLPVADKTMLSDSLLKMIDEEYSLQGEDGEWYSCLEDLKRKKNSKSERIKREVERKKSMQ